jgi:hypothetical protein
LVGSNDVAEQLFTDKNADALGTMSVFPWNIANLCRSSVSARGTRPGLLRCRNGHVFDGQYSGAGNNHGGTVPMRSKLLISTTALLAGVALASAQEMPRGGNPSGSSVQSPAQHANPTQSPSAQGSPSQRDQDRRGQSQQQGGRAQKDQTTGQAPRAQKDQGAQGKDSLKNNAQTQSGHRDQTTGQSQRDQGQGQSPRSQRDQTTGQTTGQSQRTPTQAPAQGQTTQQGQAGQAQTGQAGSTVTLTPDQRTRIRETFLVGRDPPRVSSVNFKIAVGTAVPSTVHVVEVPDVIVEIDPEWRGYWYFVVGDEIIIVDRGHRIVAVIAV